MSAMTTPMAPSPNSSSVMRRVPRLTARARALLTAMNLHFAGVAALMVIALYMGVHLVLMWGQLQSNNSEAMASQRAKLRAATIAAQPMHGLDAKVAKSTEDADQFYADRLPYAYSQVAAELGALTKKAGVRLTHVQYGQVAQLSGKDALTEVRMDTSVAGDYRPSVEFINSLERDKMFFLITSVNLTGQQSGQVNLRLRLVTFLRQPNLDESTKELMVPGTDAGATPAAAAGTGGAQ